MPAPARDRPLLVLFDGNALVHRAYHALPPLSVTRTGEPVSAVYGFTSMLLKVLAELKPTHYAIAFDRPGPTFRHLKSAAYKAQRPTTPEELAGQFQRVRQLVAAFHMPIFELDGFEADDLLGAMSQQAAGQGAEVIIVTGDLDTLQLVTPQVRVLTSRAGRAMSETVTYDEAGVRQKYGLAPQQLPDFKGLKGDPSDNIAGVPGVGDKTAARLIQQFGSVEAIYQHLDEVTPDRLRQILKDNAEAARESKELATIVTDLPVVFKLDECRLAGYDHAEVTKLFRELEFASLLPKLSQLETEAAMPAVARTLEIEPRIVNTPQALESLVTELRAAPAFAIDLETTSLEPMRAALVGIALCPAPGRTYYIPVGHRSLEMEQLPLERVLDALRPLLASASIGKVAHNGNYEGIALAQYGVELRNLSFDTMLAAWVLGEKALGLKPLAFGKLDIEMQPITALIGTGSKQVTMAQVSIPAAARYACADAEVTMRLKELLEAELREEDKLWRLFSEVEMPLAPVLSRMECNGVALDTALLRQMSQELAAQLRRVEADIYANVGHEFNINSSQQLGMVLFDELRLHRPRRTKSGYSTDAAVLEVLQDDHPVVRQVLEYRQLAKLKSTYLDALPALVNPRTGRVHTSFNQTGTVTGRISSSDPNLQNIPIRTELGRKVRNAFIAAPPARLLAADYSQIDLRVLAHLSQDPLLLAAFTADEDIHAATAAEVFGVPREQVTSAMRRVAKTVNFGVIYGMSEFGLEQATGLTRQESASFIKTYFERYSGVQEYLSATKRLARQRGYVETILGRRRFIPDIGSTNAQVRAAAERMAINMPVQGTSADIIKLAMISLQQRMDAMGLRTMLILQIHDELLFEVPPEELPAVQQLVNEMMPGAMELSVPLKVGVSVGNNWGEMD